MTVRRAVAWASGAALVSAAVPVVVVSVAASRVVRAGRRAAGGAGLIGPRTLPAVIVVFGAQVQPWGPSNELRSRLDVAMALLEAGEGDLIAMIGGVVGHLDEVESMVAYARTRGVPDDRVIGARPGQNTREQVATMRRLYDEGVGSSFIAVSSAFHLRRIEDEARRRGHVVRTAAPAVSPETQDPRLYRSRVLTEALGTLWYALPPRWTKALPTSAGTLRHSGPLVLGGRLPLRALTGLSDRGAA